VGESTTARGGLMLAHVLHFVRLMVPYRTYEYANESSPVRDRAGAGANRRILVRDALRFPIFDMRAGAGPFFATAGVQTDKTAEAVNEFFKELNGIHTPVPLEELTRAKNYLALGFPSQFETTSDIARKLEELIVYDLPTDYFGRYVETIQAVSAADVHRAAQRYIQPDRFAVVVIGDATVVEAPIRALNLGPLQVLSVTDVMGSP